MNKTHLLSLVAGGAVLGTAFAGTSAPAKGPVAPPPVVEESSMITGSVTLGYDTDYVYRGFEVLSADGDEADQLVWGALDLNAALTDKLSLNFNTWYASSASANYDELDVYTRLTYDFGPISVGPSFKWYHYPHYPSSIDNQYEVGLELFASPVENLNLSTGAFYEFEAEQWYFQFDANYTIKVAESFSLVPGATVSYIDVDSADFALDLSDFHHVTLYLKAPIQLAKNVVLTPYIAGNFPLSDIDEVQDDIVYGGASLSVSF
ncbi:MAG: hypothetical protein ACKV19_10260 [Verrucomicrobiales bacterium]